jgi:hypothetical protein
VLLQLSEMIGGQKYNWFIIIFIIIDDDWTRIRFICVHHDHGGKKLDDG